MNLQIRRLFFVFATLFAALVVISTYWLWKAPELEARRGNPNLIVRELTIKRGLIYAADGKTVFARNRPRNVRGQKWYFRVYPTDELVAHLVGYSTVRRSRTGLEQSLNDYLTGSNADLHTVVDRTLDQLKGLTQEGNDVVTTIDLRAQRTAMGALAGKCGAAVALEPETGRVLAFASTPSYDPNLIERDYERVVKAGGPCDPASPLLIRAADALYIPGSVFKVVTASAALDSGRFSPSSTFQDPGYCIEYGQRVFNYADQSGPAVYGRVTFAEAVENSINSVFCNIGKELGGKLILEYARKFGFYEKPPLETPDDEKAASGLYENGKLFFPEDPNAVDPGRLAFGQERLLVTPLQMAMVAAGIANRGVVMEPTAVDRIVAPDRTVILRSRPEELSRAIKAETAAELSAMMVRVVDSGTGTAAQIPGVDVAGKTGTAETGREEENQTWFVAFAPADAPKIAVAVTLQDQPGTGGETAAPIAREIIEAYLRRGG